MSIGVRAPFACVNGERFDVVTERGDLGYGRGRSGNWWALRAFGAMCDEQVELPYPYTLWVFPLEIRLAVERVLKERGREVQVVSKPEFEAALVRIVHGSEENGARDEDE